MYMPKVHENKTINFSLREEKKYELKTKKAFTDYSQAISDAYEDYNSTKKWRTLIVFDVFSYNLLLKCLKI